MKKVFKPIPGYDGYKISKDGTVIDSQNKILSKIKDRNGYIQVRIDKHLVMVHRLLAFTFIKNNDPNKFKVVNHIDGNKSNNDLSNLEWCDHRYNNQQAIYQGLRKDAIPCLVRQYSTGIVTRFPSSAEAKRFMGIPVKTHNPSLYPKLFGWLTNDDYEFRWEKDIKKYPFFYTKESTKKIISKVEYTITYPDGFLVKKYTLDDLKEDFKVLENIKSHLSHSQILNILRKEYPNIDFDIKFSKDLYRTDTIGKIRKEGCPIYGYNRDFRNFYIFKSFRHASEITKCDKRLIIEKNNKFIPVNKSWYFVDFDNKDLVKRLKNFDKIINI
jgi:uncharacterized HNH endonuclease L245|nr:MAG TPA: homing endonuclease [Caudoviricetes sp.]